jgi:hypothetical protein
MNKYQTSIDTSYHDRCRGLASTLVPNLERYNSIHSGQASEEPGFFSDDEYKEHSKQLVGALSEWANEIRFVSCKYEEGELQIRNELLWRPTVPYMRQMLLHLNSAYKDTFPDIEQIQNQRNSICNEIRDLMTTDFGPIPHRSSYDIIVGDQIKKSCPNLKKTINVHLDIDLNNFYFHNTICKIIFETVRDKRLLDLTIRPSPTNGLVDLARWGATIARGDNVSISKLKTVVEQLVLNEDIHVIVRQYHELKKKLDNDSDILNFREVVAQFREFIFAPGPHVLGGAGSCNLCFDAIFKIQ